MNRREQSKAVSNEQTLYKKVICALACLLFVLKIWQTFMNNDPPVLPTTTDQNEQGPSQLAFSPARLRLCSIVRRIDSLGASSGGAQSAPASPELFEFLGLDPTKPPVHPSCAMVQLETPRRKTCRDAISAAWLSKLDEFGFSECTGSDVNTSGDAAETRKDEVIDLVREGVLFGGTRHGLRVEEECMMLGRLVNAVANALWDDESRADYIHNLLPVLRPRAESLFSWGSAATRSLDMVCPRG